MADNTMPAAEASPELASEDLASYELAFHVLPTVAEGEVTHVVDALKKHIETAGGTLQAEETPQRFDLAYEIIKHLEGKNRSFKSAYFGWMRFTLTPSAVDDLMAQVDEEKQLLRYLLIRLTRVEEENPFYFHDALEREHVTTVDMSDDDTDGETDATSKDDSSTEAEEDTASDETTADESSETLDETKKKEEA